MNRLFPLKKKKIKKIKKIGNTKKKAKKKLRIKRSRVKLGGLSRRKECLKTDKLFNSLKQAQNQKKSYKRSNNKDSPLKTSHFNHKTSPSNPNNNPTKL